MKTCKICGKEIVEGEIYYQWPDFVVCTECNAELERLASMTEEERQSFIDRIYDKDIKNRIISYVANDANLARIKHFEKTELENAQPQKRLSTPYKVLLIILIIIAILWGSAQSVAK